VIADPILSSLVQLAESLKQAQLAGELGCGCAMAATGSPITSAWSQAEDFLEQRKLSSAQQQQIYQWLAAPTQQMLTKTKIDDFDLVYEYLLQQLNLPTS